METLINFSSKINVIHLTYVIKLALRTRKIDINTQKINKFYINTFKVVRVDGLVENALKEV